MQGKERSKACRVKRQTLFNMSIICLNPPLKCQRVCLPASLPSASPRLASSERGKSKTRVVFHGSLLELCVHVQTAGDPVTAPHVCSSGSLLNSGTFPQPGRCDEFFMLAHNYKDLFGKTEIDDSPKAAQKLLQSNKDICIQDGKRVCTLQNERMRQLNK